MALKPLPEDFREFLKLLYSRGVEYLVIGGYAVAYHGYPRPTGDIDIWITTDSANAEKVRASVAEFGFDVAGLSAQLFQEPNRVVRIGVQPVRIDILNTISGVAFAECFARRVSVELDGVPVHLIGLADLKKKTKRPAEGSRILTISRIYPESQKSHCQEYKYPSHETRLQHQCLHAFFGGRGPEPACGYRV